MKEMKRLTAMALTGLLALTSFASFAATSNDFMMKENTAKFHVEVNRTINSASNQDYKIRLYNDDVLKLNQLTLEFDYNGQLKCNNTGRYMLEKTEIQNASGAFGYHYKMTFINKWDGMSLAAGKMQSYDLKGELNGGAQFENVLLSSSEKPLKEKSICTWKLNASYEVGQIVAYKGQFYKVRLAHTAHAPNWSPDIQTALFVKTNFVSTPTYNVTIK